LKRLIFNDGTISEFGFTFSRHFDVPLCKAAIDFGMFGTFRKNTPITTNRFLYGDSYSLFFCIFKCNFKGGFIFSIGDFFEVSLFFICGDIKCTA